MDTTWKSIAKRTLQGLGVMAGDCVHLRDRSGRLDVLLEMSLAIEYAGATPLLEVTPPEYLEKLLDRVPVEYLEQWDRHRLRWAEHVSRTLVLEGADPNFGRSPRAALAGWRQAIHRLTLREEENQTPYLLVAVPTERRARKLGMTLDHLEKIVLPALAASGTELQAEIDRVLEIADGGPDITIHTGNGHALLLDRGNRSWLSDDGVIDARDLDLGAIASNLPGGSTYTTVLEDRTEGTLWLPKAGPASEITLTFDTGRIVAADAASGAQALLDMLDAHTGEPRRVGHIGIGLNPHLAQPVGWTLVDEHVHGHLFLSLGENRYMGGQNESSLNVDYAIPNATLVVGGEVVVGEGHLMV